MKPSASNGRIANNLPVFFIVFSIAFFGLFIFVKDVKSMVDFSGFRSKTQETREFNKGIVQDLVDNSEGLSSVSTSSRTIVKTQEGEEISKPNETRVQEEHGTPILKPMELLDFESILEKERVELPEECDLYTGEWVYDNITRPLYKENECPYLTRQVTCLRKWEEGRIVSSRIGSGNPETALCPTSQAGDQHMDFEAGATTLHIFVPPLLPSLQ